MNTTDAIAVTISNEREWLRIGPADAAPATSPALTTVLRLPGADVTISILDPSAPPSASLYDAEAAQFWLGDVYGDSVSEAVARFDPDREDSETLDAPLSVAAQLSHNTYALQRLGLGLWLYRHWPLADEILPIDEQLLMVEVAAQAWRAEALFGEEYAITARMLQPIADGLVGIADEVGVDALVAEQLREPSVSNRQSGLAALVLDALRAASVRLAEAHPARHDALRVLSEVDAQPAVQRASAAEHQGVGTQSGGRMRRLRLDDNAGFVSAGSSPKEFRYPLAAGGSDLETDETAVDSVDWSQVPPRVLDWEEDTLAWTVGGDGRIHIEVVAASGEDDLLFARVFLTDQVEAQPILDLIPLALAQGRYTGSAKLPAAVADAAASDLIVDVYAPGYGSRALVDPESRRDAREGRARIRSVIAARSKAIREGSLPQGQVDSAFPGQGSDRTSA